MKKIILFLTIAIMFSSCIIVRRVPFYPYSGGFYLRSVGSHNYHYYRHR